MTEEAQAFWVTAPGAGEIRAEPVPAPVGDEVVVRTLRSGISRGTETLVFRGRVPESQYAAMRAPYQEGDFPGPVKYGYLSVGVVEHGPAVLLGRTVFCLYPHQTAYVVPAAAVTVGNVATIVDRAPWDGTNRRIARVTMPSVPSLPTKSLVSDSPATSLIRLPPSSIRVPSARTTSRPRT